MWPEARSPEARWPKKASRESRGPRVKEDPFVLETYIVDWMRKGEEDTY